MATLYLTEQGTTVRKVANRLVIERDGQRLGELHDFKIERVVVFGNVQLTTQTVRFLLESGIETAFVSLSGKLKGRLAPIESKNIGLRIEQFKRAQDPRFALRFARAVIGGKIDNCIEVIGRQQRNHVDFDAASASNQLRALRGSIARADSVEALRGLEGQAAAVYFKCFARMLRRSFDFDHRTRRPPTDPINALLSLGYALLHNEAISAVSLAGFDPYLGFYHVPHYGRCSLALDLIEEMRPLTADRLTLNLINMEIVKAEDFRKDGSGAVFLEERGRRSFFREYERLMNTEFAHRQSGQRTTLRRALYEQAVALQRVVLDGIDYQPFRGWH